MIKKRYFEVNNYLLNMEYKYNKSNKTNKLVPSLNTGSTYLNDLQESLQSYYYACSDGYDCGDGQVCCIGYDTTVSYDGDYCGSYCVNGSYDYDYYYSSGDGVYYGWGFGGFFAWCMFICCIRFFCCTRRETVVVRK